MTETKKEGKKASNRLLGMKFMQRSLEKEKQEELEKERKRVISEAEWVLDREQTEAEKPKIQIEYQSSFLPFTQATIAGRRSFQSFNKKVEALTEEQETQQRLEREEQAEKSHQISDKAMGEQMQTIRTVSKSSKKRKNSENHQSAKKPKATGFIKPK
ncbi:M-phase phosphoprotein 6-domain-containing protein [Choanephora cucurbitarum]|nr:M-phase phosphoprotein 6-domain-containing protein [Choanephora cucurbitarum]